MGLTPETSGPTFGNHCSTDQPLLSIRECQSHALPQLLTIVIVNMWGLFKMYTYPTFSPPPCEEALLFLIYREGSRDSGRPSEKPRSADSSWLLHMWTKVSVYHMDSQISRFIDSASLPCPDAPHEDVVGENPQYESDG